MPFTGVKSYLVANNIFKHEIVGGKKTERKELCCLAVLELCACSIAVAGIKSILAVLLNNSSVTEGRGLEFPRSAWNY